MTIGPLIRGSASAALAAGLGAVALGTRWGRDADAALFEAVNRGHGPAVDRTFAAVTELGSLYAVGAAAGTLAALGRPREAVRAAAAAGATWALGQAVKRVAGRPRPYDADPSGTRAMIAPPIASWAWVGSPGPGSAWSAWPSRRRASTSGCTTRPTSRAGS